MLEEVSFFAAFLVGLFGGVHCIGMCGGIVGALGFGLPESARGRPARFLPYLAAYNGGRLLSYTIAGALVGGIGALANNLLALYQFQLALQAFAGLFMVALGLYLAGWWQGLVRVERAGDSLWRRLEPLARKLLPVHSPGQAFVLGSVWGWLPCGLVYSVLVWSVSTGSAPAGALLLLSFGLGTMPNLLAMGLFATSVSGVLRRPWFRQGAGLLVILFGLLSLARVGGS